MRHDRGFAASPHVWHTLDVERGRGGSLVVGDVAFLPHGTGHTLRDAATTAPEIVGHGTRTPSSRLRTIGGTGDRSSLITGFFELARGRRPALLERMPRVVTMTSTAPPSDPLFATTVQLLLAESAAPAGSAIVLQRLADVLFVQALRSLAARPSCPDRGLSTLADPHIGRRHRWMPWRWPSCRRSSTGRGWACSTQRAPRPR